MLPGSSDTAHVDAATATINTGDGFSVANIQVGDSGSATSSAINQLGGGLTVSGNVLVANGDQGSYAIQGSGTLTIDNALNIGSNGSTGSFTQTGGTVIYGANVGGNGHALVIGNGGGGMGTYTISGGNLTESTAQGGGNWNYIGGNGGTGVLNVSGTATVSFDGRLHIAGDGGTTGTVNQTGGTVNANGANGDTVLGDGGGDVGTYNLSAGTFNGTNVEIGHWDNSTGILNLSGTGQFNVSQNLSLGTYNSAGSTTTTGTVNQTGGER